MRSVVVALVAAALIILAWRIYAAMQPRPYTLATSTTSQKGCPSDSPSTSSYQECVTTSNESTTSSTDAISGGSEDNVEQTPGSSANVTTTTERLVVVPDVRGMSETKATWMLDHSGLTYFVALRWNSPSISDCLNSPYSDGQIFDQSPSPSYSVAKNTLVNIYLCP